MLRTVIVILALGGAVSACGPQRPAIDPALQSGVTSSNGGGQRQTGGGVSVGVNSGVGATTTTGMPNSRGAAY